ncbi:MAG TPA: hypothetical protein VI756_31820 [Blastocatellia bacterium]
MTRESQESQDSEAKQEGSVIIISGPIGAGKTAIAREFIKKPPRPTAYIEGDVFWSFFVKEKPVPRNEGFRLIMRAMTASAIAYARDGYETVLDFSMPPGFLGRAFHRFGSIPVHYIVLRPSKETCASRAAARPLGKIQDYSEYNFFYDLFNVPDKYLIEDDICDAATMANRIREGIDTDTFLYSA